MPLIQRAKGESQAPRPEFKARCMLARGSHTSTSLLRSSRNVEVLTEGIHCTQSGSFRGSCNGRGAELRCFVVINPCGDQSCCTSVCSISHVESFDSASKKNLIAHDLDMFAQTDHVQAPIVVPHLPVPIRVHANCEHESKAMRTLGTHHVYVARQHGRRQPLSAGF